MKVRYFPDLDLDLDLDLEFFLIEAFIKKIPCGMDEMCIQMFNVRKVYLALSRKEGY